MSYIDTILNDLRQHITENNMSKLGFSKKVGVSECTIRHLLKDGYSPRASTVRKLEEYLKRTEMN